MALTGGTGGSHQQREGMFLADWNETLRSHSAVVSLCSPSAPSRTISQDGADGKTAQDGARRNKHNRRRRRRRRSTDKTCHAFRPQWNEGFFPIRNSWVDRTTNFLRAVHDIDVHRASHRFGCGKQGAPISLYHPRL